MRLRDITEGRNFTQRQEFAQVVNATMKAARTLSPEAARALETWQSTNWHVNTMQGGTTDGGPEVFNEVYAAFAPVRTILRKLFGDTITLHRGIRSTRTVPNVEGRTLYSWTLDLDVANNFAGKVGTAAKLTDKEIADAVAKYERTGFVSVLGYTLVRDKDNLEYFNIWRHRELLTDGDDVAEFLTSLADDAEDYDARQQQEGRVTSRAIAIGDILWVAHELGSVEFIVIGDAG